jgi:cytochrome c oxidase subunit 2
VSNDLKLPLNQQVQFNIRAKDVIHSFWVPDFRLKQDAVPGLTTRIRTRPTEKGGHPVVCAELCGLGHATMRQTAVVIPKAAFARWVNQRSGGAKPGPAGAKAPPPNGKQIFTAQGCTACHTLADAGSTAKVGPDLDNVVADAKQFCKGQSPAAYIKQSIVDPGAIVRTGFPAGTMPQDYGKKLTPQELNALVSYLQKVGGGKGQ